MTRFLMGLTALCMTGVAFAGGPEEPRSGTPGANEAIEARSARQQVGAEFDRATSTPVLIEEVPPTAEAPTVIDEPEPEVPVTPAEVEEQATAAAEFARQPGEPRSEHIERLLQLRPTLVQALEGVSGNGNVIIQTQAGRDVYENRLELERIRAETERLDDFDAQLRAARARLTALEAALETAAAERRQLRGDLDALDARVTTELARIDRDTEFLAARIADNSELIEALTERTEILEATDRDHTARLDGHDVIVGQIRKGTQSTVDLLLRVRGSSHGSDVAIGIGAGWTSPIGASAWIRESQLSATYHPLNDGIGAGFATRFLVPVSSEVPVYCGPELSVSHAALGWTDGGGRGSGALSTFGGGFHCGLRPQEGSFSAGLTAGGDVGYLGLAGPDTGSWAPGGNVGLRLGWSW